MAYQADSFVADEQPTTAKWNKLWSNDASFNDGSGIADDKILTRHLLAGNVTAAKLDSNAIGHGFIEIGRDTWSSGTSMTASSLPNYKYLKVVAVHVRQSEVGNMQLTFNGDSGSNYAYTRENEGGAINTGVSQAGIEVSPNYRGPWIMVGHIVNVSGSEKAIRHHSTNMDTAGAANAPRITDYSGKWTGTAVISSISISRAAGLSTGAELIVYGKN